MDFMRIGCNAGFSLIIHEHMLQKSLLTSGLLRIYFERRIGNKGRKIRIRTMPRIFFIKGIFRLVFTCITTLEAAANHAVSERRVCPNSPFEK